MISVQQAQNIIFDHKITLNTEGVSLMQSHRRVLAEDLVADRDFPPFDRVTMDGIAIRFEDFKNGQTHFKNRRHTSRRNATINTPKSLITHHPLPMYGGDDRRYVTHWL